MLQRATSFLWNLRCVSQGYRLACRFCFMVCNGLLGQISRQFVRCQSGIESCQSVIDPLNGSLVFVHALAYRQRLSEVVMLMIRRSFPSLLADSQPCAQAKSKFCLTNFRCFAEVVQLQAARLGRHRRNKSQPRDLLRHMRYAPSVQQQNRLDYSIFDLAREEIPSWLCGCRWCRILLDHNRHGDGFRSAITR